MKQTLIALATLAAMCASGGVLASAQSIDDLNLQVHGYATQGLVYTNHNSWDTTDSENGSAAWTEAVVNLSMQPTPKLRIGVQGRYYLLGDYGDSLILDWAQVDYQVNQYFGVRVGDVKTPTGLFNETQDIDSSQLWALLPQSIYPIASRNSILDHYGSVVYGTASLGEKLGKLDYSGFGGTRKLAADDGYLQPFRDAGFTLPNGLMGPVYGATLDWRTPLNGLMFGATEDIEHPSGEIDHGSLQGTFQSSRLAVPRYFGKYEGKKLMFAGEYERIPVKSTIQLAGLPPTITPTDQRNFYGMSSYKVSEKLTGGVYYSSDIDRQAAFTSSRYQKDWDLTARYDFNQYLYAKFEQHFIDGTSIGFTASDNPNLQPTTRMTIFKLGASF